MFYAYIHQPGGCDYTIGCGNLLIELDGNNREEALADLKQKIRENYTGDRSLEYVKILEVSGKVFIPVIEDIYDEIEQERYNFEKKEKELKERQEFERLKAKFGSK